MHTFQDGRLPPLFFALGIFPIQISARHDLPVQRRGPVKDAERVSRKENDALFSFLRIFFFHTARELDRIFRYRREDKEVRAAPQAAAHEKQQNAAVDLITCTGGDDAERDQPRIERSPRIQTVEKCAELGDGRDAFECEPSYPRIDRDQHRGKSFGKAMLRRKKQNGKLYPDAHYDRRKTRDQLHRILCAGKLSPERKVREHRHRIQQRYDKNSCNNADRNHGFSLFRKNLSFRNDYTFSSAAIALLPSVTAPFLLCARSYNRSNPAATARRP